MLSKYSFHPVLIWLMAVAGVNAGINAAILSPRQKSMLSASSIEDTVNTDNPLSSDRALF